MCLDLQPPQFFLQVRQRHQAVKCTVGNVRDLVVVKAPLNQVPAVEITSKRLFVKV